MIKNITYLLIGLTSHVFLFSCGKSEQNSADIDIYFPVGKIVDKQIDSLKKSTDIWIKTVEEKGVIEEKKIVAKDTDWKTELAMFFDLNPNKKAYLDQFTIDTTFKEDGSTITYQSEKKLQLLVIVRDSVENVKAVYGDLHTSNIFYTSDYKLSLVPYKAFAIEGNQQLNFGGGLTNFYITWKRQEQDSVTTGL